MKLQLWRDNVQVILGDGTSLGEAEAELSFILDGQGQRHWQGEIRAPIGSNTKVWPAMQSVKLLFSDGEVAQVNLEPAIREVGPTLVQVAWVRAAG